MDEDADELSTTTDSDLSPLYKFFLCSSCSLPLTKFHLGYRRIDSPREPMRIHFTPDVLTDVFRVRALRNSRILRHITGLCRTPPLATSIISQCIPLKYKNVKELTCGGMSRIYSAQSLDGPPVVIKVTDCSRGLGSHEYMSYQMLAKEGFAIPSIEYVAMYKTFLIIILSRHSFSLSSLLLTLAGRTAPGDSEIVSAVLHNIRFLLHKFQDKNISYCDFSPDNIMIDVDRETLEGTCILIDPQFALHTSRLTSTMGRHWAENIDRVHFAYKIRALALQEPSMTRIAEQVCHEFLGYTPSGRQTKRWILNVLPDGLRIAYDSIVTPKKTSRKWYGQSCW